ncbi:MAG: class I SAM-dependent methyltransferase [Phycisphaerales bacterium]|nr:MAG: class I SAM-dependent methyltransferase [Phycisphaerales bacterium]
MTRSKGILKRLANYLGFEVYRRPKDVGARPHSPTTNRQLDLSRAHLITDAPIENLKDVRFVERLLLQLGLNDEMLHEFPGELHQYTGQGLLSWQYPNQFSRLLVKLSEYPVRSYMEIGAHHGGTFVIVCEYLRHFNPDFETALAIDKVPSDSLAKIAGTYPGVEYLVCDSRAPECRAFLADRSIDLVLIDGDHSLDACMGDFELVRDRAGFVVLHDISSTVCPGVCATWQHIKAIHGERYDFFEFLDQYEDVYRRTGNSYMGFGLAVRRT